MRILYVCDALWPRDKGGAEHRVHEIATHMVRNGHTVSWIQDNSYVAGKRSLIAAIVFTLKVFYHLRKEMYDVIHCVQAPVLSAFAVKLAKGNAKFVLDWYEVWKSHWKEYAGPIVGRIGMFLERWVLQLPDIIIAPTNKTLADISTVSDKPQALVSNGIDYAAILKVKPSKEKFDILDVARLVKGKRIDMIVRVAHRLKPFFPKLRIAVIGSGPEMEKLQAYAKAWEVDKNIKFFGRVESSDDIFALMKSSKLMFHPSEEEGGSSIVTLEANACGIPVVAAQCPLGISAELIRDGKNGYLEDIHPLIYASRIMCILKNVKLRKWMRKHCLVMAKKHDWSKVIKQYEKAVKC